MRERTATGQFKASMKATSNELLVDVGKLLRQGSLRMYRDLIILTPKDTEWASQHWSVGLDRTTEDEMVVMDSLLGAKAGDTVHVFNNVEYIKRLDEGWSSQRPSGFSKIAASRAEKWFNDQSEYLSAKVYRNV